MIATGGSGYDADDRLTSDTYDASGNTTGSGGLNYVYDFENHLIQQGGATMVYDGDGNRVSKTVAGVTTTYLVSEVNPTGYAQVMSERFSGGAGAQEVLHNYVYGLDRISQYRSYFTGSQSLTQISYYVYDGHGSSRALTDPNGNVTDTYDYDAFGNLTHSATTLSSPTPNEFLFAGEQYDSNLHLYYNRARYLNTSTGRFWSMDTYEGDPQSPVSLHKYLYAGADPIDNLDPSGNQEEVEEMTATAVYVFLAAATLLTLAYVCAVYANTTGGGPCSTPRTPTNYGSMRIQLQLGDVFTVPGTPVLQNVDPPGVTILQLRQGLQGIYSIAKTSAARFPFNSLQSDLVTAVVIISQQAGIFAPYGVTGAQKSVLTAPIGDSAWRIDVDNLSGTNLRE